MLESAVDKGEPRPDAAKFPLLHQKIFAPYKIAILIDTAAAYGIAAETILVGTSLHRDDVHDPHARTCVHDYIQACENIVAADPDPELALDVGSRLHLSAYGVYGYALMCSPTMRDFFDFAVRYHQLATPVFKLGWRREGDRAIWQFGEIYGEVASPAARRFLVRQQMMMTVTHVRDLSGAPVAPLIAMFALPDTGAATGDARRLGCPCSFDAAANELHYPAAVLDSEPQFANRLTYAWLEETCDDLIGRVKERSGVAGDIHQRLTMAPQQAWSMQAIARQMGVTERTLRRRLAGEGARYADIADDVRKRLALRYMRTTRMSADDIAATVGFTDTANLRRAVKRWTGQTFGDVRRASALAAAAGTGFADSPV